jgi:hypothetical protein
MRMGFWQKFFSFRGYIGALVLAMFGLAPANFAKWLSDQISPQNLSWIASDKARWAFVLGAVLLFAGTYYKNRGTKKISGSLKFAQAIRTEDEGGHFFAYATVRNTNLAVKITAVRLKCE